MTEKTRAKLLILDDEEDMLRLLTRSLSPDLDCDIATARNGFEALALLDAEPFDVVLADVRMPGMGGMEFLERVKAKYSWLTTVMMTAYGSIDLAVQAIKNGAYDFITKPFEHESLIHLLRNALERSRLVRENLLLQRRVREGEGFREMVGRSPKLERIFQTIQLISKTDVTVLITGESGTGKDLAARAIHAMSDRTDRAFIAVNCPNLPESILESELFGHSKGAFTDATSDKRGLFLEAQDGTIYLDEIGDISLTLQTKLLRVLQEKEIRPVGQTRNVKLDVRIIASTNQNLAAKIRDGSFREDLFYRLNVMSLHMPPLRERSEDIPLLVNHFLDKYATEFKKPVKTVSQRLMQSFLSHSWRGNVRELENIVSRAVILSPREVIEPQDIDWDLGPSADCLVSDDIKELPYKQAKAAVLERFHREFLADLLARNEWNITRAARACGLERQALQQVMRRYGIRPRESHASGPSNTVPDDG